LGKNHILFLHSSQIVMSAPDKRFGIALDLGKRETRLTGLRSIPNKPGETVAIRAIHNL